MEIKESASLIGSNYEFTLSHSPDGCQISDHAYVLHYLSQLKKWRAFFTTQSLT